MKNIGLEKLFIIFVCVISFSILTSLYELNLMAKTQNIASEMVKLNDLKTQQKALGWQVIWGGSNDDMGMAISIDNSDSIYVVGKTDSFGERYGDIVLLKYDKVGNLEWQRFWGSKYQDIGIDLAIDNSSNLYVVGGTTNPENNYYGQIILIKYDSNGNLLWSRNLTTNTHDLGVNIVLDSGLNIYIIGLTDSFQYGALILGTPIILKFDNNGELLWNITLNDEFTYIRELCVDSCDNVYVNGVILNLTEYPSHFDFFISKYDKIGNLMWYKELVSSFNNAGLFDMIIDSFDNIYVTGNSFNNITSKYEILLMKLNSSGDQIWNSSFIINGFSSFGYHITLDNNSNILIIGKLNTYWPNDTQFLLECDYSGVMISYETWGESYMENVNEIAINSLNEVFLVGEHYPDDNGRYDISILHLGDDTDGDRLSDWKEVNIYITNPESNDTDNDNLSDWQEVKIFKTNPNKIDTDADGFTDYEEIYIYSTDPNNKILNPNTPLLLILSIGLFNTFIATLFIIKYILKNKK